MSLVETAQIIWDWDLAYRPDGGFTIAWAEAAHGPSGPAQVFIRRFDNQGAPTSSLILVAEVGAVSAVAIASDALGNELIAFRQAVDLNSPDWSLSAGVVSASGELLWPPRLVAEVVTPYGAIYGLDVAASPTGGWIVAWEEFVEGDPGGPELYARTVALAEGVVGPKNSFGSAGAQLLDGLRLASGPEYVLATWREPSLDLSEVRLVARLLSAGGVPSGDPISLYRFVGDERLLASLEVAAWHNDRFLVSWSQRDVTGAVQIRGVSYLVGAPEPTDVQLIAHRGGEAALTSWVGVDRIGRVMVGWTESPSGSLFPTTVMRQGRLVSGSALTAATSVAVLPGPTATKGSVSERGGWVVAWDGALAPGNPDLRAIRAEVGAFVDGCQGSQDVLCLVGSRFMVGVSFRDHLGREGQGRALPLTPESGTFWFFSPDNVEVMVKVVDACAHPDFNDFWVYAAGMTDVATALAVIDTWTGEVWERDTALGEPFPPVLDSQAFHTCGASPLAAP